MHNGLTYKQIETFHEKGCLFPIQVLSHEELRYFRNVFREMECFLGSNTRASMWGQLHLNLVWADELTRKTGILDILESLIGSNILVHSTTVFMKQAKDEKFVSWHQDGHYWQLNQPKVVSVWLALEDSTVENGCLQVIPGSHTAGELKHETTALSPKNLLGSGIEVSESIALEKRQYVTLKAGEMSLHDVNLVHGSGPNTSAQKRLGFAIRYMPPEVQQHYPHHEVIQVRGSDAYGHYEIKPERPAGSFDKQMQAHLAFLDTFHHGRLAIGRPNG